MGIFIKKPVTRSSNLMIGGRIVEFKGPKWPYKFVCHLDESRDMYALFIIKPIVRFWMRLRRRNEK